MGLEEAKFCLELAVLRPDRGSMRSGSARRGCDYHHSQKWIFVVRCLIEDDFFCEEMC